MSRFSDLRQGMRQRALAERIPLEGGIEITNRCNHDCVHCFRPSRRQEEMSVDQATRLIDEVADEGCLFLTFTGGEPTLHRDFLDLHRHARARGLLTTVFTNGTTLDSRLVSGLQESPPYVIELSLYGSTPESYEAVTGRRSAFDGAMRGVHLLKEAGLPVHLKTVFMRQNRREYAALSDLAERLELTWDHEMIVSPGVDGDLSPLGYRLSAEQAVTLELANMDERQAWLESHCRLGQGTRTRAGRGPCNAGINIFLVDVQANLHPCVLRRTNPIDVSNGGFAKGWRGPLAAISRRCVEPPPVCSTCPYAPVCLVCPAWSALEEGDRRRPLRFACDLTRLRHRRLGLPPAEGPSSRLDQAMVALKGEATGGCAVDPGPAADDAPVDPLARYGDPPGLPVSTAATEGLEQLPGISVRRAAYRLRRTAGERLLVPLENRPGDTTLLRLSPLAADIWDACFDTPTRFVDAVGRLPDGTRSDEAQEAMWTLVEEGAIAVDETGVGYGTRPPSGVAGP